MATFAPFARPLYVMAKPVGSSCNLACDYCYYLEKSKLYAGHPRHIMSDELLEHFIETYITAQTSPDVLFTWHGGEPLLRPIDFYRKAIALQQRYAQGRLIENCIQTNGTLLTDEWCRFFRENNWLVGISIDGPPPLHDRHRPDRRGRPTSERVMQGLQRLSRHGVEWNAMATVNRTNAAHPLQFYRFLKAAGAHYIQFTPVVERLIPHPDGRRLAAADDDDRATVVAPFSVDPAAWGEFLCTLFDEWVRNDVGHYYIQLFDATLANWIGHPPGLCSMAPTCGHAAVMEHNGDVYACDHYVFPQYRLGNIRTHSLVEMLYSDRQQQFGRDKYATLPHQCRNCPFLFACHGECPKNRFDRTADGEPGLNYLCRGYYRFFSHAAPYMDYMKHELLHDRPPANVMEAIRHGRLSGY